MHNLKSKKLLLTSLAVLAIGSTSYASYKSGLEYGMKIPQKQETKVLPASLKLGPESIVKNQQAMAVGMIIGKDGGSIKVQGNDGKEANFKLSPDFRVYTVSTSSDTPSKPSKDKADIKLNQNALIDLRLQGEEYLVTNISYFPTR